MAKLLRLGKLNMLDKLVDADGRPTKEFLRHLNDMAGSIQATVNDLVKTEIELAVTTATTTAVETDVAAAARLSALVHSYIDFTGTVLTAAVSPTDSSKAEITVASHTRIYGDGAHANVLGGALDLLDLGTEYFVYYEDAARAGGAVSFVATTNYLDANQIGDRHVVGKITTPSGSGDPPIYGGGFRPWGAVLP
ncbi:MAG TPA: hypothetical protein VGW40_05775 [Allosphingosinicella sp.]|nr:hypothetical protein [Allosphingosinicella sp.]